MTDRAPQTTAERVRLWFVKASLLLILAGILVVGRNNEIWPIINWPMYARHFDMPDSTFTAVRLDIVRHNGTRESRMIRELAPIGEHNTVTKIVYCTDLESQVEADIPEQCTSAIMALARRAARTPNPVAIEMWELEWEVTPRGLPPFDKENVDRRTLIRRIELENSEVVNE